VHVYIDNLIIASKDWNEHKLHVQQVIARMNELNLKLSVKKLKVGRRSIRLLGHEISAAGVKPDPQKEYSLPARS